MIHETATATADLHRTVAEQAATIEMMASRINAIETSLNTLEMVTADRDAALAARITQVEVPRL